MITKFNKYERVAGLFVLTAICGFIAMIIGTAVKKGWFETKINYQTILKNAEGVREGSLVQIAGLRAGAVTRVELRRNHEISVELEVSEQFADRIRQDSVVRAVRPFLIGDKALEITAGSEDLARVAAGGEIKSEVTADVMDLISGRSLGPYLETVSRMAENLKSVAEALLDPRRSKAIVQMFDQLSPLMKNANSLSREATVMLHDVNKDKRVDRIVANLALMTDDVARLMPAIERDSPEMADDLRKITKNAAILTEELAKTLPMLQEIGPEFPRASHRAMEALDETVVTLKALQKSFLLRGNVRDVREEESQMRMPASEKSPEKK